METKTHWHKVDNPDYLGAYALMPGEEMNLKIKSIGMEIVENAERKTKEEKRVCHFYQDVKPLVLNATNCKAIAKLYESPYMEDWVDRWITIYSTKVKAFGETVDAIRIKNKVPTIKTYKCDDCGSDIKPTSHKTVEEIVSISKQNCEGKTLCIACMKKFKEEKDNG